MSAATRAVGPRVPEPGASTGSLYNHLPPGIEAARGAQAMRACHAQTLKVPFRPSAAPSATDQSPPWQDRNPLPLVRRLKPPGQSSHQPETQLDRLRYEARHPGPQTPRRSSPRARKPSRHPWPSFATMCNAGPPALPTSNPPRPAPDWTPGSQPDAPSYTTTRHEKPRRIG